MSATFTVTLTFDHDPFAHVTTEDGDLVVCAGVAQVLRQVADGISGGAGGGTMPLTFDQAEAFGLDATLRDGSDTSFVSWNTELRRVI